MVKLTSPVNSVQIVPTQSDGITLVSNDKGFHFRRFSKPSKYDSSWAYIYGSTKKLASDLWHSLSYDERVSFSSTAETYHRRGQDLHVQETCKSVFESKFGEGKFGSVRFS